LPIVAGVAGILNCLPGATAVSFLSRNHAVVPRLKATVA
jgi:hypothetical protein